MKYLKYGIAVLLCCLLLPAAAWAEPAPTQDRWFHGQIYVDNIRVTSAYATSDDGYCYLDKNDRLMISLRGLISMLDMDIQWDADTQQVIIPESKNGRVVFQLNSKEYFVNGEKKGMDTEAVSIAPGRVHVPLRYLTESIGAEVQYSDFVAFGMKQVDIITSEERSAENLKNSNVRKWAKNVCALTNFEFDGKQYESGLNRTITATEKESALKVLTKIGVENKVTLLDGLKGNMNEEFIMKAGLLQFGITELGYTEEEAVYMLPYTQELSEKWQNTGILGADMFNKIFACDLAYIAGYLTEREAIQLISLFAEAVQHEFENWDMAVENYIDGQIWGINQDKRQKDGFYEITTKKYAELKNSPDYYFDDVLFLEDLEG